MNNVLAEDLLARHNVIDTFERAFRADSFEWQRPYLQDPRNIFNLKGRQVGASTGAAAKCIHLCRYRPNSLAIIVSPSQKQSQEIAIRAKAGIRNVERLPLEQESAQVIRFNNGSRILSLPGTATSVRGYTGHLLVVDEAAYVEEETWLAARALVATGGQIIVQSTPAGAAGWFYDLYQEIINDPLSQIPLEDADKGLWSPTASWGFYKIKSEDVPSISKDFLAAEKRSMGEYAYSAEYSAEFLQAGMGLFSGESLRKMVDEGAKPYFQEAT